MAMQNYAGDDPYIALYMQQLEQQQQQAAEGQPEAPVLDQSGPTAPTEAEVASPEAEVASQPQADVQSAPQEERAPEPVSAAGMAASTYEPQMDGDEVFMGEPKFSRKLPKLGGMLEPSQMYVEESGGDQSSALIQAILEALGQGQA